MGVNRSILHQSIAIVKDQVSVDFDITSIKIVELTPRKSEFTLARGMDLIKGKLIV